MMKNAAAVSSPAERLIAQEMALLVANDAAKFPVPGSRVRGRPQVLDELDEERLNGARMEILLEQPKDALERGTSELERAWEDAHGSTKLPGLTDYGEDEIDEHQLMVETFDVSSLRCLPPLHHLLPASLTFFFLSLLQNVQDRILHSAERGNQTEKKLSVHLGGYQQRAKMLRQKIVDVGHALATASVSLDTFRTLHIAEDAALPRRLERLRDEVAFVARREREAQDLFRERKDELDRLSLSRG